MPKIEAVRQWIPNIITQGASPLRPFLPKRGLYVIPLPSQHLPGGPGKQVNSWITPSCPITPGHGYESAVVFSEPFLPEVSVKFHRSTLTLLLLATVLAWGPAPAVPCITGRLPRNQSRLLRGPQKNLENLKPLGNLRDAFYFRVPSLLDGEFDLARVEFLNTVFNGNRSASSRRAAARALLEMENRQLRSTRLDPDLTRELQEISGGSGRGVLGSGVAQRPGTTP